MRRARDKANYTVRGPSTPSRQPDTIQGKCVSEPSHNQESTSTGSTYSLQLLEEPVASLNIRRLETPCEFCVVVHISINTRKTVVTNLH